MKILNYETFLETMQMEVEEPEMEPNFKEITVPGTNLNLDEFEKKLGTPITQYELSEDGKVSQRTGDQCHHIQCWQVPIEQIV